MIRLFKSPQPAVLILIPVFVLILWGQSAMDITVYDDPEAMPLWKAVQSLISGWPHVLVFLLIASLVSFQAIYFNNMVNRHEIIFRNSFLPALCYVLLVSCSASVLSAHPVIVVNLILVMVFDKIYSMYKNESANRQIFDSGFLLGILSLIYFPAWTTFPFLLYSLWMMRTFSFRELLIVLTGYLLPAFFISVWYFWSGKLTAFWLSYLSRFSEFHPEWGIPGSPRVMGLLVVTGVLLVFSMLKLRANFYKNIIRTRSYQRVMFFFLLSAAVSLFFVKVIGLIHVLMAALPAALFISYFFVSAKKRIWFFNGLFWLWISVIIWNQFPSH
ncbi:MAG: hypothetical protein IT242_09430 [Bacteroidia bacterium]|nr:hypothetical protein [Bacteroidia bacterium]